MGNRCSSKSAVINPSSTELPESSEFSTKSADSSRLNGQSADPQLENWWANPKKWANRFSLSKSFSNSSINNGVSDSYSEMDTPRVPSESPDVFHLVDETLRKQQSQKWKCPVNVSEAQTTFAGDGSMPVDANDDVLEMRLVMEEPFLLKYFYKFAIGKDVVRNFGCWIDIHYYKSLDINGLERRLCAAFAILEKYVINDGITNLSMVQHMESCKYTGKDLQQMCVCTRDNGATLPSTVFDELQLYCFMQIHDKLWKMFVNSEKYKEAYTSLRRKYNKVIPNDFQYFEALGAGGFGFVIHAKKISTGKHYAIKVQKKLGLLQFYAGSSHRVTFERLAMAKCNHPFIVRLDYAFQSEKLVFMVMELGTSELNVYVCVIYAARPHVLWCFVLCCWIAGTLADAIALCPRWQMPEERVRFYCAEITLALSHMHQMGFIYRDLKPPNTLLMPDGHIKLVDLGGVVDPQERLLKPSECLSVLSEGKMSDKANSCQPSQSSPRAITVAGTPGYVCMCGSVRFCVCVCVPGACDDSPVHIFVITCLSNDSYMAPEILLLSQKVTVSSAEGYSAAVDWWVTFMHVYIQLQCSLFIFVCHIMKVELGGSDG